MFINFATAKPRTPHRKISSYHTLPLTSTVAAAEGVTWRTISGTTADDIWRRHAFIYAQNRRENAAFIFEHKRT